MLYFCWNSRTGSHETTDTDGNDGTNNFYRTGSNETSDSVGDNDTHNSFQESSSSNVRNNHSTGGFEDAGSNDMAFEVGIQPEGTVHAESEPNAKIAIGIALLAHMTYIAPLLFYLLSVTLAFQMGRDSISNSHTSGNNVTPPDECLDPKTSSAFPRFESRTRKTFTDHLETEFPNIFRDRHFESFGFLPNSNLVKGKSRFRVHAFFVGCDIVSGDNYLRELMSESTRAFLDYHSDRFYTHAAMFNAHVAENKTTYNYVCSVLLFPSIVTLGRYYAMLLAACVSNILKLVFNFCGTLFGGAFLEAYASMHKYTSTNFRLTESHVNKCDLKNKRYLKNKRKIEIFSLKCIESIC